MSLTKLRDLFWQSLPSDLASQRRFRKRQNDYNATIRSAWVDFVDHQHRDGAITDNMADKATL